VADLQRLDAGCLGILALQRGDDLSRFVAKLAVLVEVGAKAGPDEATVTGKERRFVIECGPQALDQP